jgi:flagellar motor switch protein FliN/FliY
MASAALDAAGRAAQQIADAATADQPQPVNLPEFNSASGSAAPPGGLAMLSEVNLQVKIELGRTRMLVEDVLRLTADSVIELDKLAGDPVDIFVNDHHVARGEVLVVNDNFCVRVSEIIQQGGGRSEVSRVENSG